MAWGTTASVTGSSLARVMASFASGGACSPLYFTMTPVNGINSYYFGYTVGSVGDINKLQDAIGILLATYRGTSSQ